MYVWLCVRGERTPVPKLGDRAHHTCTHAHSNLCNMRVRVLCVRVRAFVSSVVCVCVCVPCILFSVSGDGECQHCVLCLAFRLVYVLCDASSSATDVFLHTFHTIFNQRASAPFAKINQPNADPKPVFRRPGLCLPEKKNTTSRPSADGIALCICCCAVDLCVYVCAVCLCVFMRCCKQHTHTHSNTNTSVFSAFPCTLLLVCT